MANTVTHLLESNLEATRRPRREQRLARAFRLEVCGFNRFGRFFTERTLTSDVSDSGCQFCLRIEVERDSVVALRVLGRRNGHEIDSRPVLFQVERVEQQPRGWTLGVSKLQPVPVWVVEAVRDATLATAS
ncbi:MAG: hypothetical protein ACRD59_05645 [Candidatus Acidiferrales bacterium]